MDLQPATDRPEIQTALTELLGLPSVASVAHVVSLDLETVGVDLSAVPLDDVLAFRAKEGEAYKAYRRDLRKFIRELSFLNEESRHEALRDRADEIRERAGSLRKLAEKTWRKRIAFSIGAAGAAWRLVDGDVLGALLAGGASLAATGLAEGGETGAYSYLFAAKHGLR